MRTTAVVPRKRCRRSRIDGLEPAQPRADAVVPRLAGAMTRTPRSRRERPTLDRSTGTWLGR